MKMPRFLPLLLALSGCAAPTSQVPHPPSPRWIATWAASPFAAPARPPRDSVDRVMQLYDQTVRLVVRTSVGGERVRIRLSNEYGDRPLVIGAAHIAVRDSAASIVPASDRTLTFGGRPAVRMLPGAVVLSDHVALAVPPLQDLAISLHLADSSRLSTAHPLALQTSYVGHGNVAGERTFAPDTTLVVWPYLVGVDVINPSVAGVIVAFGNSITDGARSTRDANSRWPNVLAARMLRDAQPRAVVNAGISGGRVLTFGTGPSALARFERDVLATPGLTHVILLEGINDIGRSAVDGVTADDIIFGYRQLIARARARHRHHRGDAHPRRPARELHPRTRGEARRGEHLHPHEPRVRRRDRLRRRDARSSAPAPVSARVRLGRSSPSRRRRVPRDGGGGGLEVVPEPVDTVSWLVGS